MIIAKDFGGILFNTVIKCYNGAIAFENNITHTLCFYSITIKKQK